MTSVAFHPTLPALGVGSVDKTVTIFDLRRLDTALAAITGHHDQAVSYVRFATSPDDGLTRLYTSSTDAAVRVFLPRPDRSSWRLERTHRGHADARRFTGLSVSPLSGLVAVGSETEEVALYAPGADAPVARMPVGGGVLNGAGPASSFVSCTAFLHAPRDSDLLAAANSAGSVRIFDVTS